jgi:DNA-binding NarL/FixJ family response regulator
LAQNGMAEYLASPAADLQCAIADRTSRLGANTREQESNGMVIAERPYFETVLVGEYALLLMGLRGILHKTDFRVVASGAAVEELDLSDVHGYRTPLLILDSGHDQAIALRQVEHFKQQCPDARVVVLNGTDGIPDVASYFQAGANAYFCKDVFAPIFLKSLELVMTGLTLLPSHILSSLRDRNDVLPQTAGSVHPSISAQEKRVLEGLVAGHANKVIARELGIAEATVKVHVKAILRKMKVRNRTQAATWAMKQTRGGITYNVDNTNNPYLISSFDLYFVEIQRGIGE